MRLIDDYKVKAEAYLYWIKSSKMKDISTDGYVGVTASVVKKIVVEALKEPYPDVKNCCFKGVWFQFYTKLEPYDLYCILKMLDDGVTQKVIAQVYGLQGYNIGKISQTWRKARDANVQYI